MNILPVKYSDSVKWKYDQRLTATCSQSICEQGIFKR
jgi:hypothetical protein